MGALLVIAPSIAIACGGDSKDSQGSGGGTSHAGTGGASGAAGASKGGAGGSSAAGNASGGSSGTTTAGKGGSGGGTGGSGATSGSGQGGAGGTTSGGSSGAGTGGSMSGASGSGADGGSAGANGGSAGESGSPCPGQAPADGSQCPLPTDPGQPRAQCSYGDDPRPSCRTLAVCSQGAWKVTPPDASCTDPLLPSGCPEFAPDQGAMCSDTALKCWYGDGTNCECVPCEEGRKYPFCVTADPPAWACNEPPSTCPNPPPQAGSPCSMEGQTCGPSCEEPITCTDGFWVFEQERCPICASPDTPIATPEGERAIAELRPGDLVYSVDDGATVAVPLLSVGSTRVFAHHVMRIELDDGRVLELSPGHPTADGRHFSDLVAGALLDERHAVVRAELVPYHYERTYDILPASSTATYFAAGALVGTTLR